MTVNLSGKTGGLGASIKIEGLRLGYGNDDVLTNIDLNVAAGEFIALLGASGCGKTTLLRALAGFVPVREGKMSVADRDIGQLPPEQRGMAMMFQSYALWPHMSVAQNIGYGLRLRRQSKSRIKARVDAMVDLVGLAGFQSRRIGALSGGQRQRVALARALAIEPPVLLLDEPLSNLDARIRASMRHEIRSLQQRLQLTAILVTHDREEAMSMADRVVILNDGRIEQIGTPEQVYRQPASSFVARFMGAENVLPVEVDRQGNLLRLTGDGVNAIQLPIAEQSGSDGVHCPDPISHRMVAHFNSDAVSLAPPKTFVEGCLSLSGKVIQHSYLGKVYRHTVAVGMHRFLADHVSRAHIDQPVDVQIPAAALSLFAPEKASAAAGDGAEAPAPPTSKEVHL